MLALAWLASNGVNGASSWAVDASENAAYLVEVALGRYSSGLIAEWGPLMSLIMIGLLLLCGIILMSGHMAVLFLIVLLVFHLLVLGFFAHQTEHCRSGCRWGYVDRVRPEGEVHSCSGFCSVPGPSSIRSEG